MPVGNGYSRGSTPSESVFDTASKAFDLLVSGPEPLAIDGGMFEDFPRRSVPLDELARLLLGRRCTAGVKDAVWAHLVGRSRADGGAWTVGCVGLALPGLITCATKLAVWASDPADVHAAVLTGFLTGLATLDLDRPWVLNRLTQAARRAGQRAVREELGAPRPVEEGFESRQPPAPWGHPDLVLANAVAEGVITREQADMIGATRLEEVPARDYAAAHDMDLPTFWQARWRAERRLVAWLTGDDTAPDTAAEHAGHAVDGGDEQDDTAVDRAVDEETVERIVAMTGRPRAWVCAGLRTASATRPPVRATASQTGHRPGDRRPAARPRPRRSSRTVTGSGRGQAEKTRRRVSGNGDLQTN